MPHANYNQTKPSALLKTRLTSDEELLARCRAGDEDAWEQVVDKYKRLIYSIPLNFGLTSEDAADIFQQTFISLVDNLERLRPDSNLGAWLATVARRHALHHLRKRKREVLGVDDDFGESNHLLASFASNTTDQIEQILTINQGLDRIDRRCRDLLMALYFDPRQPSYEEVARRTGIAVGSVGPLRGRCLERLREALSGK
jgi:RNA polymerase sigma factor (sigma-70 family)